MTFRLDYDTDTNEFIGLCDRYPTLSWLDPSPYVALRGIKELVYEIEQEKITTDHN